uniref:PI-PLC Y-box domain-containing protein n=1 Tax=viral metagenome TaxID=1070528 RepID=A0A6C0C6M0_9ZZZZ
MSKEVPKKLKPIQHTIEFISENMETLFVWIGVIILILSFVWYYRKQINKKLDDNYSMEYIYNDKSSIIGNINTSDVKYKTSNNSISSGLLRDYYIASSYNSCCAGDFQNGYVDTVPLREVIHQGARVLDFAIYQVDDEPVVGAGPTDSDNIKGTYNSVSVGGEEGILNTINKYAFSLPTPNPTDPLFIHFRIKSKTNPKMFYKKMATYVKKQLGGRLLDPSYGYEGRSGKNNLSTTPLLNLRNKVIIMCHQETNNFRDTDFEEYINMSSGSPFLKERRNHDIEFAPDIEDITVYNKKNMTLSMPDWSSMNSNVRVQLHFNSGCQMVCMNYANYDSNMAYYRKTFNNAGSAFILKPENLRYGIVTTSAPIKQNPQLSYKEKHIDTPMYQSTI